MGINRASRLQYIDSAKGIGIILVVIGHCISRMGFGNNLNILKIIYSFHMPLFFFISGLTFRYDCSFYKYFIKKIKRLLIPTYIFTIITITTMTLLSVQFQAFKEYKIRYSIVTFVKSILGFRDSYISGWWFLPSLMVAELILFCIMKIKNNYKRSIVVVVIVFSDLLYVNLYNRPLPFCLEEAMFAMLFIYFGTIYNEYSRIKKFNNYHLTGIITLYLIITLIYSKVGFNGMDMWSMSIDNIFLFTCVSITASMAIVEICKRFSRGTLIRYIGERSFFIFGIHYIFLSICITLSAKVTTLKGTTELENIKWIIFCTIIIVFLSILLERLKTIIFYVVCKKKFNLN